MVDPWVHFKRHHSLHLLVFFECGSVCVFERFVIVNGNTIATLLSIYQKD